MKIETIIMVLENGEKLRQKCQEQLREYVLDKNIPLKERFLVWVTHCNKIDHDTVGIDFDTVDVNTVDHDFIRKINVKGIIITGCNTITWRDILRGNVKRKDEIKELLIEENFGSIVI